MQYPRVPGHEVAGVVDAVGEGVAAWKSGRSRRRRLARRALRALRRLPARRLRHLPGRRPDPRHHVRRRLRRLHDRPRRGARADPGRALRRRGRAAHVRGRHDLQLAAATPARGRATSSRCSGIGGLGHLGVQFAAKAGFRTVAIARGKDKEALARKLGAHHYIDSQAAGSGGGADAAGRRARSSWRR